MYKFKKEQLIEQIELIIPIRFFLLFNEGSEHRIFIATSQVLFGYKGYLFCFNNNKEFNIEIAMKTNDKIGLHMDQEAVLCCEVNEIIQFLNTTPYYNLEGINTLKKLLNTDDD